MAFTQTRRGSRVLSLRGAGPLFGQVTTGGAAKGAWAEAIASLATACRAIDVCFVGAETGVWYEVDVGIGAAGSEVVVIPNLLHQTFNDFGGESRIYRFPLRLAAGTRIALRSLGNVASPKVVRFAVLAHVLSPIEGPQGAQRFVQYGINTANAIATSVDPGGTVNTKGAWVQYAAATTYPIRRLTLSVAPVSAVAFMAWNLDVGVGAAGSETVVVPDVPVAAADIGKAILPPVHNFDVSIPAGARLAVRAACESNSSPARILGVQLIGMG